MTNNSIICDIIDKENGFDKEKYVSELKIYRIVAELVSEDGE